MVKTRSGTLMPMNTEIISAESAGNKILPVLKECMASKVNDSTILKIPSDSNSENREKINDFSSQNSSHKETNLKGKIIANFHSLSQEILCPFSENCDVATCEKTGKPGKNKNKNENLKSAEEGLEKCAQKKEHFRIENTCEEENQNLSDTIYLHDFTETINLKSPVNLLEETNFDVNGQIPNYCAYDLINFLTESENETITNLNQDNKTKQTLLDSSFITGNDFVHSEYKSNVNNDLQTDLDELLADLKEIEEKNPDCASICQVSNKRADNFSHKKSLHVQNNLHFDCIDNILDKADLLLEPYLPHGKNMDTSLQPILLQADDAAVDNRLLNADAFFDTNQDLNPGISEIKTFINLTEEKNAMERNISQSSPETNLCFQNQHLSNMENMVQNCIDLAKNYSNDSTKSPEIINLPREYNLELYNGKLGNSLKKKCLLNPNKLVRPYSSNIFKSRKSACFLQQEHSDSLLQHPSSKNDNISENCYTSHLHKQFHPNDKPIIKATKNLIYINRLKGTNHTGAISNPKRKQTKELSCETNSDIENYPHLHSNHTITDLCKSATTINTSGGETMNVTEDYCSLHSGVIKTGKDSLNLDMCFHTNHEYDAIKTMTILNETKINNPEDNTTSQNSSKRFREELHKTDSFHIQSSLPNLNNTSGLSFSPRTAKFQREARTDSCAQPFSHNNGMHNLISFHKLSHSIDPHKNDTPGVNIDFHRMKNLMCISSSQNLNVRKEELSNETNMHFQNQIRGNSENYEDEIYKSPKTFNSFSDENIKVNLQFPLPDIKDNAQAILSHLNDDFNCSNYDLETRSKNAAQFNHVDEHLQDTISYPRTNDEINESFTKIDSFLKNLYDNEISQSVIDGETSINRLHHNLSSNSNNTEENELLNYNNVTQPSYRNKSNVTEGLNTTSNQTCSLELRSGSVFSNDESNSIYDITNSNNQDDTSTSLSCQSSSETFCSDIDTMDKDLSQVLSPNINHSDDTDKQCGLTNTSVLLQSFSDTNEVSNSVLKETSPKNTSELSQINLHLNHDGGGTCFVYSIPDNLDLPPVRSKNIKNATRINFKKIKRKKVKKLGIIDKSDDLQEPKCLSSVKPSSRMICNKLQSANQNPQERLFLNDLETVKNDEKEKEETVTPLSDSLTKDQIFNTNNEFVQNYTTTDYKNSSIANSNISDPKIPNGITTKITSSVSCPIILNEAIGLRGHPTQNGNNTFPFLSRLRPIAPKRNVIILLEKPSNSSTSMNDGGKAEAISTDIFKNVVQSMRNVSVPSSESVLHENRKNYSIKEQIQDLQRVYSSENSINTNDLTQCQTKTTEKKVKRPVTKKKKQIFLCPRCLRYITGELSALEHQSVCHFKPFVCVFCEKRYSCKYSLKKHWQLHSIREVRDESKEKYADESVSSNVNKSKTGNEHTREMSNENERTSKDGKNLIDSKDECTDEDMDDNASVKSSTDFSTENYELHKRSINKNKSEINLVDLDKSKENKCLNRIKCNKCGESFKHKSQLRVHLLKYKIKRRHRCSTCAKFFESHSNLKRHIADIHKLPSSKYPYICRDCGLPYKTVGALSVHMRKHENPDVAQCVYCKYICKSYNDLRKHIIRRHTREFKHKCTLCDKGFITPKELKMHTMRIHK